MDKSLQPTSPPNKPQGDRDSDVNSVYMAKTPTMTRIPSQKLDTDPTTATSSIFDNKANQRTYTP